ncbi:hypothetical protein OUZ56_011490 [Daphnia magna]|uniref:Uncharacterized protein n=1 Tax=Daphnia magna TaxID=35525 RepID=A0ABQ9Z097_9CRUS|nr:hypothetical protein OUZ56_011490 [Daphnia magna]
MAQDLRAFRLLMPAWNLHNGRPILLHSWMLSLESSRNVSSHTLKWRSLLCLSVLSVAYFYLMVNSLMPELVT